TEFDAMRLQQGTNLGRPRRWHDIAAVWRCRVQIRLHVITQRDFPNLWPTLVITRHQCAGNLGGRPCVRVAAEFDDMALFACLVAERYEAPADLARTCIGL